MASFFQVEKTTDAAGTRPSVGGRMTAATDRSSKAGRIITAAGTRLTTPRHTDAATVTSGWLVHGASGVAAETTPTSTPKAAAAERRLKQCTANVSTHAAVGSFCQGGSITSAAAMRRTTA